MQKVETPFKPVVTPAVLASAISLVLHTTILRRCRVCGQSSWCRLRGREHRCADRNRNTHPQRCKQPPGIDAFHLFYSLGTRWNEPPKHPSAAYFGGLSACFK